MSSALKRTLFHIFVGLSIPIAALLLPATVLLVALGAATGSKQNVEYAEF